MQEGSGMLIKPKDKATKKMATSLNAIVQIIVNEMPYV